MILVPVLSHRPRRSVTIALLAVAGFLVISARGQVSPSSPGAAFSGPGGETIIRGNTEPAAKIEIPASVRGILAEVNVKEGQSVKKGQQLARLDDALQQQRVEYERVGAESSAEVQYAENQVQFAQSELERSRRAQLQGVELMQKELAAKQSLIALEAAKDKQRQSQAKFKEEQLTLDRMTLRSPIDGSVLRVNKQAGEQTDENPVLVVVQTSKLNAVFYPRKEFFGKIAVGDRVALDLEGARREGVVVAVDPIIDPASQIFRVKLEIDNADAKLAAGVSATWTWPKK